MAFETLLEAVVSDLREEDRVLSVFLTGSVNRGEADGYSDLDISVLVNSVEFVRNDVFYREGVLVSIERSTPEHRARAFSDPEAALWNLVSLQTGRARHDPAGVFAELQRRARAVTWAQMREQAEVRARARVADGTEELHKVMSGLSREDDAKVAYAILGLTYGLGIAALLATGTVLATENRFLTLARDAWTDPEWRASYGVLVGLRDAPMTERGHAALRAYARAVALLPWSQGPERELAHRAAERALAFPTHH